jgi:anti-anti-sigma factor
MNMSSPRDVTEIVPHDRLLVVALQASRLDETATEQMVEDVYEASAARPSVPIVLDLAKVRFAPSVALGALAKLSRSFQLDGRRIAVVNVDRRVRGAIKVTGLHNVLELYEHVEDVPETKS